ncbi:MULTISPECIES: DNA primase [unclassified Streptomyces]|uniref:DNA primase n=1 Tax=unclassified Streptomyces TaxID=2593676 RepID=UPI00278C5C9F|nr:MULTISPECIES: DNA primase [unclassified Streptomyces]
MNRTALGLAIGAGYVLGRTKKMKLALAVGTMVAGKRLNLSPRAVADLVRQQLDKNPQFKEIGDQLREDLSGVGRAATGALVDRQVEGLAGRLHDRTQGVRDQLEGVVPDTPEDVPDTPEDLPDADDVVERAAPTNHAPAENAPTENAPTKNASTRNASTKKAPTKKAPAKKAAKQAVGAGSRVAKGGRSRG